MNLDPSKSSENGSFSRSSVSSGSLSNGGYTDTSISSSNNGFSSPPGGIASLRLPVVVVPNSSFSLYLRLMSYVYVVGYINYQFDLTKRIKKLSV